jgi:hypothetical protein
MPRDYLGNAVTCESEATLRAIDNFVEGFLAYESRAEEILGAADADPGCCMANVYAGMLWMLLEAPEAPKRAAKYLRAAERAAPLATWREQLNTSILLAWSDDDPALTLRLCDQLTDEFPRDLAVVKLHQYFEFNRGNATAMLKAALKVRSAAADIPYVYGMTAFAYEQCHLLDDAEFEARTALAMRRKEPWAQHAIAHVLLTRGRIAEGAEFLEEMADTWTGLNSFMLTHIWWHLALFYISQGRDAAALGVYDENCWGIARTYSQDQVGAISLLARFEIAGMNVASRWRDLADYLVVRSEDTVQPFLTLHYLYGLARAGRPQAGALLESVRRFAISAPDFNRAVWQEIALPACEGLYAYAHGDYDAAWHRLVSTAPRFSELGGSHAQRDLFEQIMLDAAMKSGRLTAAQQMLELRRNADLEGVPVNMALAAVYSKLGLTALADQARKRGEATRARFAGLEQ